MTDLTPETSAEHVEPLAIVGMAVRAPGAGSVEEFWRNLVEGRESVTYFTEEEQRAFGVDPEDLEHPSWVSAAPIVDDARDFDATAFGMSAREALVMDPQHRMFLEVCRTALDDAGYDAERYDGTVGVYGGIGATSYQWENLRSDPELWQAIAGQLSISTANSPDYVATQVSYRMNLRGPAMTVMTACSTSLVAVHLAAEAVRNGECDMAIAGGACIELPFGHGYVSMEGYTTPDGHCRPFDADAQGTLWGSGAGAVMVKRLSDALADGDRIRGVIRGNAINNDGSEKVGFSAPSVEGQVGAVTAAIGVSGVDPRTIGYVEAHGTGTALGDPVEVEALSQVYGRGATERQWCGIGSVKSNIGHLSQAAGIVSLIKATLTVESGLIPPTLHFKKPNPAIDFAQTPFKVADGLGRFDRTEGPRRAAVSSFGIGGTNAHMIIEQGPAPTPADTPERPELLQLSAHTEQALATMVEQAGRFVGTTRLSLTDVATTWRIGRPSLPCRATVAVSDIDDAADAWLDPQRVARGTAQADAPSVAFLFSGQGAQYPGMAGDLAEREPVFAAALDECLAVAEPALRDLVLQRGGDDSAAALAQTAQTQPALFAVEYALARLWQSWGVEPSALAGHSIGEFVAAAIAGVMTPADAMRLVGARGRLMQSMPTGVMLSVMAEEEDVAGVLARGEHAVDLAAVNGPGACVVSGEAGAMDAVVADLDTAGLPYRRLQVSHAFHSRMMDPILAEFRDLVAGVELAKPRIRLLSNVTGAWMTEDDATDPDYWTRHLRGAVRFGDDLATLLTDGTWALLECGPGSQLASLARLQAGTAPVVTSLPGPRDQIDAAVHVLQAAGRLWCAGVPVAVPAAGRRVGVPTYPYERVRHWADSTAAEPDVAQAAPAPVATPIDSTPRDARDWFATTTWRELGPLPTPVEGRAVVLVGDDEHSAALATLLREAGADLTVGTDLPDALAVGALVIDARPLGITTDDWSEALLPALATAQRLGDEEQVELVLFAPIGASPYGPSTAPEQAVLAGIARVVGQETPQVSVRLVDATEITPMVAREVLAGEAAEVSLRDGRRWGRELADVHLDESRPSDLPDAVVVTGGLGGIGLVLAEDYARQGVSRLVLTSRSGLPPESEWGDLLVREGLSGRSGRAIAAVRRMRSRGADVEVRALDVADAAALGDLRTALAGRRTGIIHAAGVPGGGMVAVKEAEAARAVVRPKVDGAQALRTAFIDADLAWVVLCSSVTGTIGGVGQVDYCAANAALDAFAQVGWGRHEVLPVSVGWGGWSEVGMAAEADPDAPAGSVSERAVQHPVLTRRDATSVFGQVAPATHWLLDEHRIEGTPVIPGTGHIAHAARAAEELLDGEGAVQLTDVVFHQPFAVGQDASATVRVTFAEDGALQVVGEQLDATTVHASGRATKVTGAHATPLDLEAVRSAMTPVTTESEESDRASLVSFGPRWDALGTVWTEPGVRDLAQIRLSGDGAAAEAKAWGLHPAALDVATSFGFGHATGPFLPLGYSRVTVHSPLPDRYWSLLTYHPESGGTISADVHLVDDTGRVLVEIEDYTLRQVQPGVVSDETPAAEATDLVLTEPRPAAIRPVEGARALRRILASGLTGSVLVTPRPVAAMIAPVDDSPAETEQPGADVQGDATDGEAGEGTELERTIAQIWQRVLGVEQVGPNDDFFALGGNSLVAVQLVAEIRRATKVKLPMKALFEMPTVAQVAKGVEQLRADTATGSTSPTIPTIERN